MAAPSNAAAGWPIDQPCAWQADRDAGGAAIPGALARDGDEYVATRTTIRFLGYYGTVLGREEEADGELRCRPWRRRRSAATFRRVSCLLGKVGPVGP
jgi:hypothetical protein